MTVITAFKFQNSIAIGRRACDAERTHHGFGAGRDKAQHLNPWQARSDPFRQLKRVRFASAEAPCRVDRFAHCFADIRIAMTENQRTKALAEIDVLAAINGSHRRALRATEENRRAAHTFEGTHRTVHATGSDASRASE